MRTAKEIQRWLKKHKWYQSFKDQVICGNFADNSLHDSAWQCLNGHCGRRTILVAFYWNMSTEGYDFWRKVNNEFKAWYDEQ